MVPVNLRPLDQACKLGNRFGLVPLVLPIGIDNPIERVYAVRARMNALKGSYQPLLAFAVLAVAGLLIKPVQDAMLSLFAKKATAVMTNVPGPREPLKFCGCDAASRRCSGCRRRATSASASASCRYGGGVQFGLITDAALCPEPQAIIDRFEPEFEKLLLVTMMLPWGEAAEPWQARIRSRRRSGFADGRLDAAVRCRGCAGAPWRRRRSARSIGARAREPSEAVLAGARQRSAATTAMTTPAAVTAQARSDEGWAWRISRCRAGRRELSATWRRSRPPVRTRACVTAGGQSSSSAFAISTSSRSIASMRLAGRGVGVELARPPSSSCRLRASPARWRTRPSRSPSAGLSFSAFLYIVKPGVLARALRAAEQRADLVDHLGVEGAERDVRVGVLGRSLIVVSSAVFTLRAQALRQRLGDADALAVAAERIGHAVVGVGVLRVLGGLRLGALGHLAGTARAWSSRSSRGSWRRWPAPCWPTVMPAPPAFRPASAAFWNSPAWNSAQAASTLSSLGSGSASPACSRAQFFFSAAAS